MTKVTRNMKAMEGTETWTNAFGKRFGERVCVGVEEGKCFHEGKKFTPNTQERKDLWEDHLEQELGPREQRMRDLREEFGDSLGHQNKADQWVHRESRWGIPRTKPFFRRSK